MMTLEEFGENIANCGVLTDKEARYLLTLYSRTKPSEVLPFEGKSHSSTETFLPSDGRDRANCHGGFQLLEFSAKVNSTQLPITSYNVGCTLGITNANCDIQISELHFCQPEGTRGVDSVEIQGTSAV